MNLTTIKNMIIYGRQAGVGTRDALTEMPMEVGEMADTNIPTVVLSYKSRLLPNKKQHECLCSILEMQRKFYNESLSDRIETYHHTGKTLSYFDQCSIMVQQGKSEQLPANLWRCTLKRLDEAYKGFFRRVKNGAKAGFPRFRGAGWFDSFGFAEFSGIKLMDNRLRFKGMSGGLRVHFHRKLPDTKILSCTFRRDSKGWSVSFQVRVPVNALPEDRPSVGIDVGIHDLAVLSTGEHIPNPHIAKKHERELRIRQRALSRCKKCSNRRKRIKALVAKVHSKIKNTRNTYLHQVSAYLARTYSCIVFEDLNIKNMTKNHHLAKAINDASWGKLVQYTTYKAGRASGRVELVNPNGTSMTCPVCGRIKKKKLSERQHVCECGANLNRDHAAAIVILGRSGSKIAERGAVARACA